MMTRNLKYIPISALLMLTACTNGNGDEPAEPTSSVIMLDFGASGIDMWQPAATSRGTGLAADVIRSAGVFAVNNAEVDLVFDNRQFYNRDYAPATIDWAALNDWPYAPTKTWEPGADYVFVSYAPYYHTGVSVVCNASREITELVWEGISSISADDHLLSTCVGRTALGSSNTPVPVAMNHLMSRLRFCFKLTNNYADLRTIVVKSMKVDYPESRNMTLTATFTKDGSIYKPSYRWERNDVGTGNSTVQLRNETDVDSIILTKGVDYQALASLYYEPGDPLNMFNIEVVYDVYDSKMQLLRANDKAISAITMLQSVVAGSYYDVKIRIEPSYLYILSDNEPDADGGLVIP